MFKKTALLISTLMVAFAATLPVNASVENIPASRGASTACPRGPGTDASCPIRVRFSPGAYGAMVHGRLTRTPDHRYYAVRAGAGQRMIITFAGLGAMRGGVTFPGGSGDGPFSGDGNTITLPTTGDYIIYIGQNTMAGEPWTGRFSLGVLVR